MQHPQTVNCIEGQTWIWDGVKFEILHPPQKGKFTGNNASCVLKIENENFSILITGDIEASAEQSLRSRHSASLPSDIIIVPHHGSLTSSGAEFIQLVAPSFALFPVGHQNRFGFPKQDKIARYRRAGAELLDTARDGAIEMFITSEAITINTHRKDVARIWHLP